MTSINNTPEMIYEKEFKTVMRGYDKRSVDEYLDDIIKDYEQYEATIKKLKKENQQLREKLSQTNAQQSGSTSLYGQRDVNQRPIHADSSGTNYDILKRISRLEKAVFAKQIVE